MPPRVRRTNNADEMSADEPNQSLADTEDENPPVDYEPNLPTVSDAAHQLVTNELAAANLELVRLRALVAQTTSSRTSPHNLRSSDRAVMTSSSSSAGGHPTGSPPTNSSAGGAPRGVPPSLNNSSGGIPPGTNPPPPTVPSGVPTGNPAVEVMAPCGVRVATHAEIIRWEHLQDFSQFKDFKAFIITAAGDVSARHHWLTLCDKVLTDALDILYLTAQQTVRENRFSPSVADWRDMKISEVERMLASVYPTFNSIQGTSLANNIAKLGSKVLNVSAQKSATIAAFMTGILELFSEHCTREQALLQTNPNFVSSTPGHIRSLIKRMKQFASSPESPNYMLDKLCRELEILQASDNKAPALTNIQAFLLFSNLEFQKRVRARTRRLCFQKWEESFQRQHQCQDKWQTHKIRNCRS